MNWYPQLVGKVHPEVEKAITSLYQTVQANQAKLEATTTSLDNVVTPGKSTANTFLHTEDRKLIQNFLQANGSVPLDVTNLLGQLAYPQKAIVTGTSSPGGAPPVNPVNGQVEVLNGVLVYYNASTQSWIPIGAQAIFYEDTHVNRVANYPPGNYPPGTAFFETDRQILYATDGTNWNYVAGIMDAALASRPAGLGSPDAGFKFLGTDTLLFYYWTGAAWVAVTPVMGGASYPTNDITGTFPNPHLTSTGVTAATYGDATHVGQFTVDAHGRISSATSTSITFPATTTGSFTPTLSFSGGNVGMTYTSSGTWFLEADGTYKIFMNVTLVTIGSAVGAPVVGGLPANIGFVFSSQFANISGMTGLTGAPEIIGIGGTPSVAPAVSNTSGFGNMDASNFTNASQLVIGLIFHP